MAARARATGFSRLVEVLARPDRGLEVVFFLLPPERAVPRLDDFLAELLRDRVGEDTRVAMPSRLAIRGVDPVSPRRSGAHWPATGRGPSAVSRGDQKWVQPPGCSQG
ncbi:hypothetical protein FEZ32_10320 [Acidipropionibacterium jensenii]|nr:hypothetical protein FEZ32_10320 [Acidipropionibacterium jensenii]